MPKSTVGNSRWFQDDHAGALTQWLVITECIYLVLHGPHSFWAEGEVNGWIPEQ